MCVHTHIYICPAGLAVLLVMDAVNELESGRALAWIPRVVPARVQLLFSAIAQGGEAGDGDGRGGGAGGGEGLSMARDNAVSEVLGSMRARWGLGGDGREGVYQVVRMHACIVGPSAYIYIYLYLTMYL